MRVTTTVTGKHSASAMRAFLATDPASEHTGMSDRVSAKNASCTHSRARASAGAPRLSEFDDGLNQRFPSPRGEYRRALHRIAFLAAAASRRSERWRSCLLTLTVKRFRDQWSGTWPDGGTNEPRPAAQSHLWRPRSSGRAARRASLHDNAWPKIRLRVPYQ